MMNEVSWKDGSFIHLDDLLDPARPGRIDSLSLPFHKNGVDGSGEHVAR